MKGNSPRVRAGGCVFALVCLLTSGAALCEDYSILYSFSAQRGHSRSPLVSGSDGKFYGMTETGGLAGQGSIFVLEPDGSGGYGYSEIHAFLLDSDGSFPIGPLVEGADGLFYGVATWGGDTGYGVVFRVSTTGTYEKLYSFSQIGTNGYLPTHLILGSDGSFYGTTQGGGSSGSGTIFRFDPPSTVTTVVALTSPSDGQFPSGLVEGNDGNFYGVAQFGGDGGGGTVFRVTPTGTLTVLAAFSGADGNTPVGDLALASDGTLYGVTMMGGDANGGVVFSIDSAGAVTTVHSFSASDSIGMNPMAGLVEASDGNLYGTTASLGGAGLGSIFKLDTGGTATLVHAFVPADGSSAQASLMEPVAGHLLGTTAAQGPGAYGTVFDADTSGNLAVLHPFFGLPEGIGPSGGLLEATPGVFLGTASFGGLHDKGTVFRFEEPGTPALLHAFTGDDGEQPMASLVVGQDGRMYGTAYFGTGTTFGSVFAVDAVGNFDLVHAMTDGEGRNLRAGLLAASDGNLYGMSNVTGAFQLTLGGAFTPLGGPTGEGTLIESKGLLYGTATQGGGFGAGSIFTLDFSDNLTTIHEFQGGTDGQYPAAGLIRGSDGAYYGTTKYGGAGGNGTVFRMDATGNVRIIHSFDSNAVYPTTRLIQATDGFFYGTTQQGGPFPSNAGTVYRIDFSGTGFSVVHSFGLPDGNGPDGELIQASDGSLVGTTTYGGPYHGGVLFRLALPPSELAVTGVLPSSGPAAGGVPVAIAGSAFVAGATATVGGNDATGVSLVNPTELLATPPALLPGTLNDVTVTLPDLTTATLPAAFMADFSDVGESDIFHASVESIFRAGITAGCAGGLYCRDNVVTRAQMAVFLLKARYGAAYAPPVCAGLFGDVACPSPFADWIEELSVEQITAGCGGGNYCPNDPVTREQMAVFLLKTSYGSSYLPPPCSGVFGDVTCPSQFADWIELLYGLHVTGGCSSSPLLYCPSNSVLRGQMSAFLTRMFNLP